MFITVDGPNGVGKTTLIAALVDRLSDRGRAVESLRQPSTSELGQYARSGEQELSGLPYAALVVADRYMQIRTEIKPALSAGKTVVCDRYIASTLALQRIDGLELSLLWELNAQALRPDLSVLLTAEPEVIEKRLDQRGRISRFERMEGIAAAETLYFAEAFALMDEMGIRTITVSSDAMSTADAVARIIEEIESIG